MIPSNPWEYINGHIGEVEITDNNKNRWDDTKLYDSEREARIAWVNNEYMSGNNIPDWAFDYRGCLTA